MSGSSAPDTGSGGVLFLVGTPIGNLGDTSARAIDTFRGVDCIAAEDTRRTRALLSHFGISGKDVVKIDAHATPDSLERLCQRVLAGQSVALVTDAGMPGVSDPGAALVTRAVALGVKLAVVPGPSAVTAAVALSGFVEGPFSFFGFLPRKGDKRRRAIERIAATPDPVVLFESPVRTPGTLCDLAERMPGRLACVTRELTKVHEEVLRGTLAALAARADEYRGEVTLVLGPQAEEAIDGSAEDLDAAILQRLRAGATVKDIAAELALATRAPRRGLYARALELSKKLRHPG